MSLYDSLAAEMGIPSPSLHGITASQTKLPADEELDSLLLRASHTVANVELAQRTQYSAMDTTKIVPETQVTRHQHIKPHETLDITAKLSRKPELPPIDTLNYCEEHPQTPAAAFCPQCVILLCVDCALHGAAHRHHGVESLEHARESIMNRAQVLLSGLMERQRQVEALRRESETKKLLITTEFERMRQYLAVLETSLVKECCQASNEDQYQQMIDELNAGIYDAKSRHSAASLAMILSQVHDSLASTNHTRVTPPISQLKTRLKGYIEQIKMLGK